MDTKQIKIKRSRKKATYRRITNEEREELIYLVLKEGVRMREAAARLGLNYSSAKTILRIYRIENRTSKKNAEEERLLKKILLNKNPDDNIQVSESTSLPKSGFLEENSTDYYSSYDEIKKNGEIMIEKTFVSEMEQLCQSFFSFSETLNSFNFTNSIKNTNINSGKIKFSPKINYGNVSNNMNFFSLFPFSNLHN